MNKMGNKMMAISLHERIKRTLCSGCDLFKASRCRCKNDNLLNCIVSLANEHILHEQAQAAKLSAADAIHHSIPDTDNCGE